jgi:hypothetical protein
LKYQRELEDAIEALRTEREMWREHALICEVLLRDNGHEVPVDVARTSLAGEIRVDARGNLLDKDLRVLRCLPDVRWLRSGGTFRVTRIPSWEVIFHLPSKSNYRSSIQNALILSMPVCGGRSLSGRSGHTVIPSEVAWVPSR